MLIEEFIDNLKKVEDTEKIENPYRNSMQADNLLIYLRYMKNTSPDTLFVGEAPGYLGCALSGIPFTDEFRLTEQGRKGCLPLLEAGYKIAPKNHSKPHKETSARIMWSSFVCNDFFPMLWNIFPFHPHNENSKSSNRTPTQAEIKTHIQVFFDLLILLPSIKNIYAVGREAENMLNKLAEDNDDIRHLVTDNNYIRHPANGGAAECKKNISEIARQRQALR